MRGKTLMLISTPRPENKTMINLPSRTAHQQSRSNFAWLEGIPCLRIGTWRHLNPQLTACSLETWPPALCSPNVSTDGATNLRESTNMDPVSGNVCTLISDYHGVGFVSRNRRGELLRRPVLHSFSERKKAQKVYGPAHIDQPTRQRQRGIRMTTSHRKHECCNWRHWSKRDVNFTVVAPCPAHPASVLVRGT